MKTLLSFIGAAVLFTAGAAADVQVVGGLAQTNQVSPGQPFEGAIVLKNSGAAAVPVLLRQCDYSFTADGENRFDEPGAVARSNAAWFSISPSRITVPAGQTASVRYRGQAPKQAGLRGSYWSIVMVEPQEPARAWDEATKQKAIGVETRTRFAVQIVTELAGEAVQRLAIGNKRLVQDGGAQRLELDLHNTGERVAVPSVSVELFDQLGKTVGKFNGGRSRIYPTCSIRSSVDFVGAPAGKYTALVLVDTGSDHVMAAQYSVRLGDAPKPVPRPPLAAPVAKLGGS